MAIREWLRQLAAGIAKLGMVRPPEYQYVSIEDYVQDRGTVFKGGARSLTTEEKAVLAIARIGQRGSKSKQCFYNSQMLVVADTSRQLIYHEGYACGDVGFPLHHGWVVLNGNVIDPTWALGAAGEPVWAKVPPTWEYCGVAFETEALYERMLALGFAGTLLDDYHNHFPLLKEPRLNPVPVLSEEMTCG
jgi:hypothetical protein